MNRAWCETLGYTPDEAMARPPIELVAAEYRDAYRAAARRLVSGEAVTDFEAVLLGRDGRRIVARGRGRPIYAPAHPASMPAEGAPVFAGTYSVYRDVTAERRADLVRDRLVMTLEASPHCVWVGTRDGESLFINQATRRLLGLDAGGVGGEPRFYELMPAGEAARVAREVIPAALDQGSWSGESVLVDAHGGRIPVALTVIAHPSSRADDPVPYFVSGIARDLRAERAAHAALRASEMRYRSVVSTLIEGVVVTEADGAGGGVIVACNVSAERILGMGQGALVGRRDFWTLWAEALDADGLPFAPDALPTPRTLRTGAPASGVVFGIRRHDGVLRWLRASSRGLFAEDAAPGALPYAVVTTFADITAEREAQDKIDQFTTAVSLSPDGFSVTSRDGALLYTNAAHDVSYGYEPGELQGCSWQVLYEPEEVARLSMSVVPALRERGVWEGEGIGRRKDGTHFPQEMHMRRLPWGGVVTAVRDISERKAHEAALRELSQRDELTGLFNRRGFFAHAERVLAQAARSQTSAVLLYGDLDRFKAINDTRGHAAGDAALRAVACALREVFRPADVLGRLGGDEFVVVAEGCVERAAVLRTRLVDALARAVARDATALGGAEVAMSVGVAVFRPETPGVGGGAVLSSLLKEADAQLYAAKAARRGARAA